ncbi:MAG: plasmid replication protein RepC [Beijerinckiaceae bacterium]
MSSYGLTTSFGRRPATLCQIATQMAVKRAVEDAAKPGSNAPAAVNKWQVSRTLSQIRERLGVSDRSLSVLSALLSFHPETALTLPKLRPMPDHCDDAGEDEASCELIVFPSNKALSQRAHGMAAVTLWRHLKALVDAGLLIRRDSPNGKRYARKAADGDGRFSDAFGFDLAPLVTRAQEFEALADEVKAAQKRHSLLKERISLLRRDVTKMIALGLSEGGALDWEPLRQRAMPLMRPLRSISGEADLSTLATELGGIRDEAAKALDYLVITQNMKSNDIQNEVHQSNYKTTISQDFEPATKNQGRYEPAVEIGDGTDALHKETEARSAEAGKATEGKLYPLGMVLEACPDLQEYARNGQIRTWIDFLDAAATVRPMIGISPDAWREAQEALGRTDAHVVVATILQRSIHSSEAETLSGTGQVVVNGSPAIQSAGGYLRALTEKAKAGQFALGPVLMASIGQRLKAKGGRAKHAS